MGYESANHRLRGMTLFYAVVECGQYPGEDHWQWIGTENRSGYIFRNLVIGEAVVAFVVPRTKPMKRALDERP